MSTKRCMNGVCGAAAAAGAVWRKGWLLRSGGFATLCDKCGLAYEKLVFCESFHQKESGWRECAFCGKRLHCGCIASKSMLDLLDGGGVQCLMCLKNYGNSSIPGEPVHDLLPQSSQRILALSARCSINEKMNEFGTPPVNGSSELQITCSDRIITDDATTKCNLMHLGRDIDVNGYNTMLLAQRESTNGSFSHVKKEQFAFNRGDLGRSGCSGKGQGTLGLPQSYGSDSKDALKDYLSNPLAEACLSMSLGGSNTGNILEACSNAGARQITLSHHGIVDDGRDQSKVLATFQNVQRARHVLPKLPKAIHGVTSDASKELVPQMRVARPPAEGRGRNQLLPRYWPRITDQELQQISGDSNSTIVPLFEKVLSASDAGRIGRLVLPKACAEAYFPPISQPEGIPLKIQDAKGKEWHFQFRFWPNNNSRMYVLEGVTPCIQSLQLQAGDTVTFSRIDPEGKLVMGFRKATNTVPLQEAQISALATGALGSETFYSSVNVNLLVSGYSGLLQSLKGTGDPQLSHFSENLIYADGDVCCIKTDKHGSWANEGLLQPLLTPEKRRSRNIGSKSKRLLIDDEDAMELKLSWEEAQDLLRPPPRVQPSIVIIEDQEFEEYEEPPVLGKRTFFTARTSGGQDQWIQCDDCLKWRRIPVEFLPPSKWTCTENTWDLKRSSCAVPDELTAREVQDLLRQHAELKRQRITSSKQSPSEAESTGLDALATAVAQGEAGNQASPSAAATTRHPRHRPGCTCIVCIQPPSGKGPKHSPSCTCNVCMTVKRRFKTLMMRKKKRQSEREEAEVNKKQSWGSREELEGTSSSLKEREGDLLEGHIDLNCQPQRDAEQRVTDSPSLPQMSMMSLLQVASLPLENYLKQNRLASLTTSDQQVSSGSATVPQAPIESESGGDDDQCGSDKVRTDAAI
ncbi:B3 domain-containing protein Os07g0679700 isoform X1 [Dendrobium catenatum]|uniref:B3 domain-containing protein Os07g0679700 isoform X1 n=1 Tax=Dendrobium catenatum TaxID=906689 RepID=UPI0009F46F9C|nr:B3 domain-containing protein Os07g0679700 isoform X1 [Dendrobium catenatum]